MAKLSINEVQHIARLAHLDLSDSEIEKFRQELSSILGYVEKLNKVETSGVDSVGQINSLENVLRDDREVPTQQLSQQEALSSTKNRRGDYFRVKKVF